MPRIVASLLLFIACLLPPCVAQAQVRQCIGGDGALVYTDRKCEDIGAVERNLAPATGSLYRAYRRPACARNVADLGYELGSALNSGDVNQVAGLYDWAGMSTTNAYRLMDRLQVIASRTLVNDSTMKIRPSMNTASSAICQL